MTPSLDEQKSQILSLESRRKYEPRVADHISGSFYWKLKGKKFVAMAQRRIMTLMVGLLDAGQLGAGRLRIVTCVFGPTYSVLLTNYVVKSQFRVSGGKHKTITKQTSA
jgi:hypothetical protein